MSIQPFKSALALLALLLPVAATAAAPEEETRFVDAAKKAFDEKKPADLSKLTCWDGVSEQARKEQEGTYKLLMEEKDVTFSFKLVDADPKAVAEKERQADAPQRGRTSRSSSNSI